MSLLTKKPIIVPWDFSEMSRKSLETAIELAGENKQIHVVHVISLPPAMEHGTLWATLDEKEMAKDAESSFRRDMPSDKYPDLTFKTLFGDPGTKITDFAKSLGAGLIVIPSHGRTGLAHFFMGSVAERVTRYSPCPVLVLRGLE